MRGRLSVAVLVLLAGTAFAPAPFPRPGRDGDRTSIDMKRFQGTWRVISMEIVQANGTRNKLSDWGATGVTGVRVRDDRWAYLHNNDHNGGAANNAGSGYWMDVDARHKPAHINWYTSADKNKPGMLGLIRREGDRVVILYYATGPESRPKTFENPPANWWILTLQKGG
jgi:uncharacterized protein (TIGR03067 family)